MPSVKKTPVVGLCDYILTEKQTMDDVNGDNLKIDTVIGTLKTASDTAAADIGSLKTSNTAHTASISALQTADTAQAASITAHTAAITALQAADTGLSSDIAAAKTELKAIINQSRYICTGNGDGAGLVSKARNLLLGAGVGVKIEILGCFGYDGTIALDTLSLSGRRLILDFSKCEAIDVGGGDAVSLFPNLAAGADITIIGARVVGTITSQSASAVFGSGYTCRDCVADMTSAGDITGFLSDSENCRAVLSSSSVAIGFSARRFSGCTAKCGGSAAYGFLGGTGELFCDECEVSAGGTGGAADSAGIKHTGTFLSVSGCKISGLGKSGYACGYGIYAGAKQTRISGNQVMGTYLKTPILKGVGLISDEGTAADVADIKGYIGYTDAPGLEADFENKLFTRVGAAAGKNAGTDFDLFPMYGGRKRCIVADDGVILAYYGVSAYIESGKLTEPVTKSGKTYPIGTAVQVMVYQPKFYYQTVPMKREPNGQKEINTLTFSGTATIDGAVSICLNGVYYSVSVAAGDNPQAVATKVRSFAYSGYSAAGSGAAVVFTAAAPGAKTTVSANIMASGVTAVAEKTTAGYLGTGYHLRKARYYVSDVPRPGFKLHPAFYDETGKETEYILYSAYEGCLWDASAGQYILNDAQVMDAAADKFCSIANAKPASGKAQVLSRVNIEQLAKNRGAGWHGETVKSLSANQLLMFIELGMANTQTAAGMGLSTIPYNDTNNSASLTGSTAALGNTTGRAASTINESGGIETTYTEDGRVAISYRGIENPWGNIYKWISGVNIYGDGNLAGGQVYICKDFDFSESKKDGNYASAGFTLANANGYVSAFGYSEGFDWLFFASESAGTSSLPVGDYAYTTANLNGYRIVRTGGYWREASYAGGFCVFEAAGPGNANNTAGGRMIFVPKKE